MKSVKNSSSFMLLWKIAVGYVFTIIFLGSIDFGGWIEGDGGDAAEVIFFAAMIAAALVMFAWPFYYWVKNFRSKKIDKAIVATAGLTLIGYVVIAAEVIYVKLMSCVPYLYDNHWYCHVAVSDIGNQLICVPVVASLFCALWLIVRWLRRLVYGNARTSA